MKLAKELALSILYDYQDDESGYSVVEDIYVEERRWVSVHQLVIKDREGKLWSTYYERGLTEYQDEQPWEGHDEVDFFEVRAVPRTTYDYLAVKK